MRWTSSNKTFTGMIVPQPVSLYLTRIVITYEEVISLCVNDILATRLQGQVVVGEILAKCISP